MAQISDTSQPDWPPQSLWQVPAVWSRRYTVEEALVEGGGREHNMPGNVPILGTMPPTAQPTDVADLVRRRNLVVFVGAGISMGPVSNLPGFLDLINELIWALSKKEQLTRSLYTDVYSQIAERAVNSTIAKRFADLMPEYIMQICMNHAGESALQPLRVLEGGAPNTNHQFLARALQQRWLPAVVTTNFDCLIEDAYRGTPQYPPTVALPLLVARFPKEFSLQPSFPQLLKIHGSSDDLSSLVVSLAQVGQRCAKPPLSVLQQLLRQYPVLFAGYRGCDLDIFACIVASECKELIWNTRKWDSVLPKVKAMLGAKHARVIEGDLNQLFADLTQLTGAGVANAPRSAEVRRSISLGAEFMTWASSLEQQARLLIVGDIWHYAGELGIAAALFEAGSRACEHVNDAPGGMAFAGRLASLSYEKADYQTVETMCSRSLRLAEVLPDARRLYEMVHTLQLLGMTRHRQGRSSKQVLDECLIPALRCQEELEKLDPPSRGLKADILTNIGKVFFEHGEIEEAAREFAASLVICDETGDVSGRARSLANLGSVLLLRGQAEDAVTRYAEAAYLFEETFDLSSLPRALYDLSLALKQTHSLSAAAHYAKRSLSLSEIQGDSHGVRKVKALLREVEQAAVDDAHG